MIILLDQKSPYLRSLLINKGFKHGIKLGAAVRSDSFFIGKIVDSNYLTSRILLISDLNSKIPVIIEPGSISAILSGTGNNELGAIEYLPENNNIKEGKLNTEIEIYLNKENSLNRFLKKDSVKHFPAVGEGTLSGVIVDCDINTGLAKNINSYIFGDKLKNI